MASNGGMEKNYEQNIMVDPLKTFWVLTNSTYLGKLISLSLPSQNES